MSFDTSVPPCLNGWRPTDTTLDGVPTPVGICFGKNPAAGAHGGSRKGQSFDIVSYALKSKLEEWSKLAWDARCADIIRSMRSMGCEWPTEATYKVGASLAMLWEGIDHPSFNAVAKKNAFQAFKEKFKALRQCEQCYDVQHLHGVKAHLEIYLFSKWLELFKVT